MRSQKGAPPVGRYIRQQIIPAGMSVTEAARRLGVGRPALSNLVNGRAALSQNMALRLEVTFGADRARLIELQAASDRDRRRVEDRAVAVGTYAPSFLAIAARQIEQWAADNRARDRLPVLLRRLIHATGRELRDVDFPGYDNAQRPGWDGRVEADAAAPWVPEGRSFWELSVDQRPKVKADRDYRTRLKALSRQERATSTFVFVTPRNWPRKDAWVRSKEVAGDWKAVRALDASDLAQWLEATIAPRIWLAGELEIPTEGFQTLDDFWDRWAQASDPPMTPKIFEPSVTAHFERFTKWLEKPPGDRPLTVAADSRTEAVAFIACLFRHHDVPATARYHAVVFESAGTLRTLSGSPSPFIPIVYDDDIEREIASHYRQRPCIVVRPRNAVDREPDITGELLGHGAFEKALADMGITEREPLDRLASDSGRSPTVLRRRLSPIPTIRKPAWAGEKDAARHLIPLALVGAWCKASRADCEVLAALAGRSYSVVEEDVAELLRCDDCPVWSVGQYHGVVSRIDALFGIGPWITQHDISHFLLIAQHVLSESDPALPLVEPSPPVPAPPFLQHAPGAKYLGQPQRYSDALRSGVCETLTLLSVHGNALFRDRLGVADVGERVAEIVSRLLTPFTHETLLQHAANLPTLAEAAPGVFLALLEEDLTRPKPALLETLKPTRAGVLGNNPARCGVLWALELLAWNPQDLMRVVNILARLSQARLDDNLFNKPINSLFGIFCSGMPQTTAPLRERMEALDALCRRFPDIGWRTCIRQFDGLQHIVHGARPRWRNDAAGAGQPVAPDERCEFMRKALDLTIAWPTHDNTMLGDLVELLGSMSDHDRLSTWDRINAWARTETDEKAKATLRERIRRAVFTPWGSLRNLGADQRARAHDTREKLASRDPVLRHAWIFADAWASHLTDLPDDSEDTPLDPRRRAERIGELRTMAMGEIWSAQGLDGALALLPDSDGWSVGYYAASCAADRNAATGVLLTCLSADPDSDGRLDDFVRGFLGFFAEDARAVLISTVSATAIVGQKVRLFRCAPFRSATWRLLDCQDPCVREPYWRTVQPRPAQFTETEIAEVIDGLLEADRPKDAFEAVHCDWGKVETGRLRRLLTAIEAEFTLVGFDRYRVSEALESLDGRGGVTVDEMARFELAFIEALDPLDHAKHGIPNLERKIVESPFFFVQAVILHCKPWDSKQERRESRTEGADAPLLQHGVYRLLGQLTRIPGMDEKGAIDSHTLMEWIAEARRLYIEKKQAEIGDQKIGHLLSRAPAEDGGRRWPCEPVCHVLETIASKDVEYGFRTGVGFGYLCGDGMRLLDEAGAQERDRAAKYRAWEEQWRFRYPYVANILKHLAEEHGRAAQYWDSRVLEGTRLEY